MSFIKELELLGFKNISSKEKFEIVDFISDCSIIQLNDSIKRIYIGLRKKYHLKLADAIIAVTAITYNYPFITADKQFKTVEELDFLIYWNDIN